LKASDYVFEAIGLTAAFAIAPGNARIYRNVVAAFYHDHIFIAKANAEMVMKMLRDLASSK